MEKNLYIDASHPDETRIVLKSDSAIEEYEYEDKNNLLDSGAMGLIVEDGTLVTDEIVVG